MEKKRLTHFRALTFLFEDTFEEAAFLFLFGFEHHGMLRSGGAFSGIVLHGKEQQGEP